MVHKEKLTTALIIEKLLLCKSGAGIRESDKVTKLKFRGTGHIKTHQKLHLTLAMSS